MQTLLRWLTDDDLADAILGDLREQYSRRARRSRAGAAVWLTVATMSLLVQLMARKLADATHVLARGVGRPPSELRHAVRSLRRAPWYAATVVGVVALSMALATTVFAVVDGVLFKPLPYERADEVYLLGGNFTTQGGNRGISVSARDYRDWAEAVPDIRFAAHGYYGILRRPSLNAPPVGLVQVTPEFLDVIGVRPLLGGFQPEDFELGLSADRILVSYELWQQELGGRPDVVGALWAPTPESRSFPIAGVLPRDFVFPTDRTPPDVLRPLFLRPQDFENRRQRLLTLVARIPSTVPLPDAQARLNATAERLMSDYPGATGRGSNRPFDRVAIAPIAEVLTYQSRTTFTLAFTAVLVLLLLAALNLAGLAAARAEDRLHHVALRRALGAGAWTLTRLQLVESLILAAGGTILGLALAPMLLGTTLRLLPETMTLVKAPEVDVRVLGFAALAAFVVAVGVSVWPAVIAVRSGLGPVLAQESSRSTRAGWLGRRAIVAAQVAVAFALAVGGTLMVGSLIAVWQEDPGYRRADVVTVEARMAGDAALHHERLVELGNVVRRVPGIADLTVLGGVILHNTHRADVGWIPPDGAEDGCLAGPKPSVDERVVDVLGLTVRAGRPIGREDIEAGRLVSVVSRQTAAKCWPGEEAVGKTFVLDDRTFTVVGVVDDARLMTLDTEPQGETYFPDGALRPGYGAVIAARTTGGADAALPALASTLRESEFAPEIVRVATMDTALAESVRPRRLTAWLFGGFGLSALVIVGVGVLGLVAMTAARRTREIGIRCALGASSNGIVRLLVREQLLSVTIGLVAGALATLWAVRFVESYSYGLTTASPVVWAAAAAVLLLVAATGAIVPALRASRVNPVDALRAGSGLA